MFWDTRRSLLHQACDSGNVILIQSLIREHKADVNARDDQDITPLCVAALTSKLKLYSV